MGKQKIHPAWWMLATSCAIIFVGLGIVNSCAGVFFVPVCEELGFSKAALSFYLTLQGAIKGVAALFAGRIIPRCNIRRVITITGGITCITFMSMSLFHSVFSWYIAGAIIGITTGFCGLLAAPVIVNNWFQKKLGLALGIALTFSGIAGMVLNPLIGWIIVNSGWRMAYFVTGTIGLIVLLPFSIFVVRFKPADIGLKPYGAKVATINPQPRDISTHKLSGISANEAFRTVTFYLVFIGATFLSTLNAIMQHIPSHIVASGYPITTATTAMSILMLGMIAGKVLLGAIKDKFGFKTILMMGVVASIVGMLLLTKAGSSLTILIIGVVMFGLGLALPTLSYPIVTREIFGMKGYSAIYSVFLMGDGLLPAIAIPAFGHIYDVAGSYQTAFETTIGVLLIALVLIFIALYLGKNLIKKATIVSRH